MKKMFWALLLMVWMIHPISVKAAEVTITPDKTEVEVGESITYTVTVTNGSGTLSVDGGTGEFDNNSREYVRTYSAVNDYAFTVTGSIKDKDTGEYQDINERIVVKVVEKGSLSNNQEENNTNQNENNDDENQNDNQNEETKLSSDATLSFIELTEGTLKPAFDPTFYGYEVELDSRTTSINISVKTTDDKAIFSGAGKKELVVGLNEFEIEVIAEDGTTAVYEINVMVDEYVEEIEEEKTPIWMYLGISGAALLIVGIVFFILKNKKDDEEEEEKEEVVQVEEKAEIQTELHQMKQPISKSKPSGERKASKITNDDENEDSWFNDDFYRVISKDEED